MNYTPLTTDVGVGIVTEVGAGIATDVGGAGGATDVGGAGVATVRGRRRGRRPGRVAHPGRGLRCVIR